METRVWTVVFALMLLQGAVASQEPNDPAWCKNFGLLFHQYTSWREQGKTVKQSLEYIAQTNRELVERSNPVSQDTVKVFNTLAIGVVVHVYQHPMYRAFGPEMNRNMAQSRCEQVGAENFMLEIDKEMRKLVSQK